MHSCSSYESAIAGLLGGDLEPNEREQLATHAAECDGCRRLIELHAELEQVERAAELPDDEAFARARRHVLARIRDERPERVTRVLRTAWLRPAWAAALAAALVLALAAGVLVGRAWPFGPGPDRVREALLADLAREARDNHGLADVENSPYTLTNVVFEPAGGERLALRFDVTRRVEVARHRDDALVRELLAQTLVQRSPIGTRLDAVDQAGRSPDRKLDEALIYAVLNDESLAVRMKAFGVLATRPPSVEIHDAFVAVLGGEPAVPLRLQALDYLARHGAAEPELQALLGGPDADAALRVRAAKYAWEGR